VKHKASPQFGIFLVFQPQSNKKKEERGKGKRRKKEEKEGRERRKKEEKRREEIHFIIPNQQVFPPGYPDDGELPSLRPNGENTVAAVRTSMRRRVGTFLNIVGRLLPSFVALARRRNYFS
jgi:hypothetical protein